MNHCYMYGAVRVQDIASPTPNTSVKLDYRALVLPTPAQIAADPTNPANEATVACALANKSAPPDGPYTVSYLNTGFGEFKGGNAGGWTGQDDAWQVDQRAQRLYTYDCMAVGGHGATWRDSTDFTVSGGVGNSTRQIPSKPTTSSGGTQIPDLPGTESAVCIQQKAGTYTGAPAGGQTPMIVM
jgi:hypothetical protein